jgi:hypothetical protein
MNYPHGFCPNCGTSVYARAIDGEWGGMFAINVGRSRVPSISHTNRNIGTHTERCRYQLIGHQAAGWEKQGLNGDASTNSGGSCMHALVPYTFDARERMQRLPLGLAMVKNIGLCSWIAVFQVLFIYTRTLTYSYYLSFFSTNCIGIQAS